MASALLLGRLYPPGRVEIESGGQKYVSPFQETASFTLAVLQLPPKSASHRLLGNCRFHIGGGVSFSRWWLKLTLRRNESAGVPTGASITSDFSERHRSSLFLNTRIQEADEKRLAKVNRISDNALRMNMRSELEEFTEQDILERIQRLGPQQIAEVVDFIEFLAQRNQRASPLMQFLSHPSGPRVGLEEVRRRLAKIQGNMSDVVGELRDERDCADRPFAALIREEGFSVIDPEDVE